MYSYKNPILLCDYSDPDVIRVKDSFYMTASSFNFVPGLPLLKSKNLVDWVLCGYAAKTIELPGYENVQNAKGIWAPSIRFHNGLFYIFFATPDEGIFETHTEDFEGEWSSWNCVWQGKGFIDPCPVWVNDGGGEKVYVVHAYAKSRTGFNSKLGILELDRVSLKAAAEDKIIFDGTENHPTIEGPKIYRKDGFFYILAPAGGVTYGWQTALRSKNIFGPYEDKIVLAQGKTNINGPHQGGYIETEDGSGYFLHFQDAGIYGRISHLQPVKWVNGWPLMGSAAITGSADKTGEPLDSYFVSKEVLSGGFKCADGVSEFQYSGNAGIEKSKGDFGDGTLWLNPFVCTKKISSRQFEYEKEIFISDFATKDARHGIIFLGDEYSALEVKKEADGFYLAQIISSGSEEGDGTRKENTVFKQKLNAETESIILKMAFEEYKENRQMGKVAFSYSTSGSFCNTDVIFYTKNAHWVGGRYGYY